MASEPVIDIPAVLAPIPGDDPAGVDAREDAAVSDAYYDLKDARAQARTAERQAFEELEDPTDASAVMSAVSGDWADVAEAAQKMLATQTKDIEVAGWLLEALVRTHGFPGLRDGFRVVAGLASGFGAGLYPRPDEDETIEETVAPITGLNGIDSDGPLIAPLRMVRLSDPRAPDASLWHERMAETGSASFPKGAVDAALASSDKRVLGQTAVEVGEALEALAEMDAALTDLAGIDAPPLMRIREELEATQAILMRNGAILPGEGEAGGEAAEDGAAAGGETGGAVGGPGVGGVPGQIQTREQAFEALSRVASFFRRVEPHSPISYTLDEIVRRGRMPMADLLREVLPDDAVRHEVLRKLGIDPKQIEPQATGQG